MSLTEIQRDPQHNWHPCVFLGDIENMALLMVDRAEGRVKLIVRSLLPYSMAIMGRRCLKHLGMIVAANLNPEISDWSKKICQEATKLGAFLRPLGNTLYWLPPLIINKHTVDELRDITLQAIQNTL